ncbi:MAG TPA: zinc ribbon domain-containing protein, partial [Polyangiaceae bacterium]|nr:zinc ribbon domain-containing protein [Polyangiaceae bacterium]
AGTLAARPTEVSFVFCPNCGTQNPDSAQTCSKCSFHLKSAAAPKFKGTMLMMNQPGAPPGPPLPPGRPGAAGTPPPPGAGYVPSKLKGTMVGVAPMAGGIPFPPPPGPGSNQTPPPPGAGLSQPSPNAALTGEAASAFSPPVPQPGVNPLGGTVAADAGILGALAAHHQAAGGGPSAQAPYGSPQGPPRGPAQSPGPGGPPPNYAPYGSPPYAAPPQQPGGYSPFAVPPPPAAPPAPPYGAQPNAFGGYDPYGQGQQPPAGYGPPMPMQPPGGQPGQAMVPFGPPGGRPMVGTLKSSGAALPSPTRRNAWLTMLLPFAVMFGGVILSVVLAFVISPALGSLASLFVLGGAVWYLLLAIQMTSELKSVTHSDELAWWPLIVPVYQLYFMWIVVPQEVAKAKQMLGARQLPQNIVLYIFLWHFALASDLNDLVR